MMEKGFTFLDEAVHGIRWDAKYATWDNFTGKPVDGYAVNRVVGTLELADALQKASETAAALGYGLLLWDGYRPQRAVNCFLHWSGLPEDGRTKKKHYPNIDRGEMIAKGYVAARSSHSRGSAIDLTIYDLNTGDMIPMGSDFDFMDCRSHHTSESVTVSEAKHRKLLRAIMTESGFEPYENEWWHYLLKDEPYPDQYFDFPIVN